MINTMIYYELSRRYRMEALKLPEGEARKGYESAADRLLDLFCREFNLLLPDEARKVRDILGI